jgi:transcriptional regulator with XRE-family HTH domain
VAAPEQHPNPRAPAAREESVDARVRRRLREFRAQRGLTLQQVAERVSIDISTLSRIEAGKRRLALDHIPALAAALGVSADELLGAPPAQDPRVRDRPRSHEGMRVWPLTRLGAGGGPRAFRVNIGRARRKAPAALPVHEGLDWLYVLSGSLRLILGDQEFRIEPGEAAEFSGWTPHWMGAIDDPVELIMVLGPQGERLHLHR